MQYPPWLIGVEPVPASDNSFTRNSRGKIEQSLPNILRALSPPYSDLVFDLYDPDQLRERTLYGRSLPVKYEGRWLGFYPAGRPGMWTPLCQFGTFELLLRLERMGFGHVGKGRLHGMAVYIFRKTQGIN
jgi:hypothetical protein